jgi:predicted DNA-binding transcriptional regulator YafY
VRDRALFEGAQLTRAKSLEARAAGLQFLERGECELDDVCVEIGLEDRAVGDRTAFHVDDAEDLVGGRVEGGGGHGAGPAVGDEDRLRIETVERVEHRAHMVAESDRRTVCRRSVKPWKRDREGAHLCYFQAADRLLPGPRPEPVTGHENGRASACHGASLTAELVNLLSPLWHYFPVNRTDRLYTVREELRRAGSAGRTAEDLARRLEVSPRTIKRDISALQQGGFPVWARVGRHGGYVVDASATLPPVNFTAAEVAGLAAALACHHGEPFSRSGRAALAKVLSVMDDRARDRVHDLAGRVWVDHETAGRRRGPNTLDAIERALIERRVLALGYRDRAGIITDRRVDPQLLARTGGRWYLVATCKERSAIRWFRTDRVVRAHVTTEMAVNVAITTAGDPPPTAAALVDLIE